MAADAVLAWLLEPSEPAIRYLASRDLVTPRPSERALARLRAEIPDRGMAAEILARQKERTYWVSSTACYVPRFTATIWQLQVLADLGLDRRDERIANAVELVFDLHVAEDGGFTPWSRRERAQFDRAHYRHKDRFRKRGHLCTTGNLVRSLVRFGYLQDERVQTAVAWLVDEQYPDGGWNCFPREPPGGTIDGWEAMSAFAAIPPDRRSADVRAAIEGGAEFFLRRRLLHEGPRYAPWYLCRYPWHYHYDHLVGLDFLTGLGYGGDPRMQEALANLAAKRRPDGRWKLDHTNGNLVVEPRGRPSKMITFLALRVQRRAGRRGVASHL